MIGSGVYPVVLPWLALLFPIPNPPGGLSSPNLSAGSSIARQALGLDSRNNGGWLLGYMGSTAKMGCPGGVPVLFLILRSSSQWFPLDFKFGAWHAVLCPLAEYYLVAPHSTLHLIYWCGYPAGFHLGSPWRLFCGMPTASHPHPWLVPYLDGTDTRDFCF